MSAAVFTATPELADEYGRICAKYCNRDGKVEGDNRYLFMAELALALCAGGAHGKSEAWVRELALGLAR